MTKLTYIDAIDSALNGELTDEVREKLEALKVSLNRRNQKSGERKPTKTQVENAQFKADILSALAESNGPVSIKGLCEICDSVAGLSNQRITRLLTDLRKDKQVKRTYVKKVAYFALGSEEEGE